MIGDKHESIIALTKELLGQIVWMGGQMKFTANPITERIEGHPHLVTSMGVTAADGHVYTIRIQQES